MIFEEIVSDSTGIHCGARMNGCKTVAGRVCTNCGIYLCENDKCSLLRHTQGDADLPERILCPQCAALLKTDPS